MECNLGSEIGLKMRSAVKAKLLELGTGGSSGFIDDELPDYVMVMVANKRTKQQMAAELNLFLGDQTDLFVTWLHEVLQKLQEVTLPTASASSKKRKSRQLEARPKSKEKDKRHSSKKDKRVQRKSGDEMADGQSSSADAMPVISSITDAFAEELLEKAKKSLDIDINAKDEIVHKKKRKSMESEEETGDGEVAPTTDISSTANSGVNRQKDLAELAEIQKKIHAAKKHLRKIGEIEDESDVEAEDDDDDDLLNINEQEDEPEIQQSSVEEVQEKVPPARKTKSPIIFKRREQTPPEQRVEPDIDSRQAVKLDLEIEKEKEKPKEDRSERRSVHDRLGSKQAAQPPSERPQRGQKELYVPAHRRRLEASEAQAPKDRSQRERSRERRSSRDNLRESNRAHRQRRSPSPEAPKAKQRIGSRVIVAVHKPPEPSDDEDMADKPVNSVIKIKPRPQVSPRRQACKNLLMRAVADAQRSTILAKTSAPSLKKDIEEVELVSSTSLGKRKAPEKLERDRSRDRAKRDRSAPTTELFRRSTRELVVNVLQRDAAGKQQHTARRSNDSQAEMKLKLVEEEYGPSLVAEDYEPYVPQLLNHVEDIDLHIGSPEARPSSRGPKTQFVVTLNGEKTSTSASRDRDRDATYRKRSISVKRSSSPVATTPQQVTSSSAEPTAATAAASSSSSSSSSMVDRRRKSNRALSITPSPNSSPSNHQITRSLKRNEVLRQQQEIKKIIIKNDTDEDDETHSAPPKKSQLPHKRQAVGASSSVASANGHKEKRAKAAATEERSNTPPLPATGRQALPRLEKEKRAVSKEKSGNANSNSSVEPLTASATAPVSVIVSASAKNKHTPIRFTLKSEEKSQAQAPAQVQAQPATRKRRSGSHERDASMERRKVPLRNLEDRKYDNLPALSAVSVDSAVLKVSKPKERCKYHPSCTKQFCEYYHPTAPCKSFPNCKFADKCMYSHPKCMYDMSCMSIDCNYAHSGQRDLSHVQLTAPPLSSHVIPVQNYKSISAPMTATTATTMCKYYPNCTKVGCTFYHPKPCRFGKNCVNKLECVFYHPEMQSKFKWVASMG
ncbi:zinc finger CCCH domain-containing protein 18 [Drosophila obscura]|uniref:zinc finger CCCH domain-containing protein 18 n=1 Tax=Drosophila obscura TaxID=7282 RepID=UPI001BB2871A|nr:zinc finger CCCH domain-containing protein 18 [Drosophila obscura]